ncbi:hypothetical protein GCM10027613_13830 [Microlunatus endophyticus]
MKITNITTAVVRYHGEATLVRIDTDEGISGYGEANPDAGAGGVVGVINTVRPMLIGEDPEMSSSAGRSYAAGSSPAPSQESS